MGLRAVLEFIFRDFITFLGVLVLLVGAFGSFGESFLSVYGSFVGSSSDGIPSSDSEVL